LKKHPDPFTKTPHKRDNKTYTQPNNTSTWDLKTPWNDNQFVKQQKEEREREREKVWERELLRMLKVIRASQGARNSENNKIQKVLSKPVVILQKQYKDLNRPSRKKNHQLIAASTQFQRSNNNNMLSKKQPITQTFTQKHKQ
jgi:hypothetical protein